MEAIKSKAKNLLDTLMNLVYPRTCIVCRKELDQDIYPLCRQCIEDIKTIEAPHCLKCGRHLAVEGVCDDCSAQTSYIERAYCATLYDSVMKECIHSFKYKNKLRLMRVFKKIMLEFSIENLFIMQHIDLAVPVPLHPVRLRERTYNQASLLAAELAGTFLIQFDNKSLKKIKNTRPQSDLNKAERLKNIKGSFKVKDKASFDKKRILLVDDVFTTGATLNECAKTLLAAGAGSVSVFTLARGA